MSSKRMYRRVSVNQIELEYLKDRSIESGESGTCVGLDIAKSEIVVVVRWGSGSFERPWSVKNASEIPLLIERLLVLKDTCDSLTIGLESTGTYGEAVRLAMTKSFLEVHRVSGKSVSDYQEIFDGVPSQHDGKDAAMIAELTAFGKGTAWSWQPLSQADQQMRHQVQRLHAFKGQVNQWLGRLEGLTAKHWPELSDLLQLKSVTLLKIMIHYGSPSRLAADPEGAANLKKWSRSNLSSTKIQAILQFARSPAGIPMGQSAIDWIGEIAEEVVLALNHINACENQLQTIAREHEAMTRHVDAVGAVTLCVIWSCVGDPRQYSSSGAFLKALGLNLKELSSGKRQGELAITKRGPGLARKMLFFWALRAVQQPQLRPWYKNFQKVGQSNQGSSEHRKMKGLIAMMRKLCRSLWYVCYHDQVFDYGKVFPGKPLQKRKRFRRRRQRTQGGDPPITKATPQL